MAPYPLRFGSRWTSKLIGRGGRLNLRRTSLAVFRRWVVSRHPRCGGSIFFGLVGFDGWGECTTPRVTSAGLSLSSVPQPPGCPFLPEPSIEFFWCRFNVATLLTHRHSIRRPSLHNRWRLPEESRDLLPALQRLGCCVLLFSWAFWHIQEKRLDCAWTISTGAAHSTSSFATWLIRVLPNPVQLIP